MSSQPSVLLFKVSTEFWVKFGKNVHDFKQTFFVESLENSAKNSITISGPILFQTRKKVRAQNAV